MSVPGLGFGSGLVSKFQIKPDPDPNMGYRTAYGINAMLLCAGFKPNMYRLMQTTGKTLEMAVNFTKLFHAKRNRFQLLSFLLRSAFIAMSSLFKWAISLKINPVYVFFHAKRNRATVFVFPSQIDISAVSSLLC
jgi:hypothetical protein